MSKKISLLTIGLGVGVLAGLAYGASRRRAASRRPEGAGDEADAALGGPTTDAEPRVERDQEAAKLDDRDPLDIAIDLNGVFDGDSEDATPVTARVSTRAPTRMNGDDQDPPNPDELGRVWLVQATESEASWLAGDDDPALELENIPAEDDPADLAEDDPANLEEDLEADNELSYDGRA